MHHYWVGLAADLYRAGDRSVPYAADDLSREIQHGIRNGAPARNLDQIAHDWSTGVDHGMAWPLKIIAAKYHAVEAAWRIVDKAMDLSGGFGMFRKNELERVFRDARAGRFHPANSALTHELVAKMTLGINPDDQPRWG